MNRSEPAPWVNVAEAADILHVSIPTIVRWLNRKPAFRATTQAVQPAGRGGTWLLKRQALLDLGPEHFAAGPETDTAA